MIKLQQFVGKSVSKYIKASPNKIRRVLKQITGKSYLEALTLLNFLPYCACLPVRKTLQSAVSNLENKVSVEKSRIIIKEAFANPGSRFTKFRARAKGRANKIITTTSNITIIVN